MLGCHKAYRLCQNGFYRLENKECLAAYTEDSIAYDLRLADDWHGFLPLAAEEETCAQGWSALQNNALPPFFLNVRRMMPPSKIAPLRDDLRHKPLPGTAAFIQDQADQDCRDLAAISGLLRRTSTGITPILQRLTFRTLPLAALESCTLLDALAEEIDRDDVTTVQDHAEALCAAR
ncbi:hypothetical protein AD944_09255 [Acetobacter tropicalis]|nr:hypothetical protein AD944_09255 [Acetobacter tropicalis]